MSDTPGAASTVARAVVNKYPSVESKPLDGNKFELVVPSDKIRDVVAMIDEEISDALYPFHMFCQKYFSSRLVSWTSGNTFAV